MGVKSTITLTRKEAEAKYIELFSELHGQDYPRTNKVLEDILETMNDAVHDGEGFENYRIKER